MALRTEIPQVERRRLRVAYVLKRFPRLSETFILNELLELERQGVLVEVYSLMRPPKGEARHDLLAQLKAPVFYLPKRSALEQLSVGMAGPEQLTDLDATPQPQSLEALSGNLHGELASLFIGKTPVEVHQLWLQANTLALLCATRGIEHMHAHFSSNAALVALLAGRSNGIPFSFTAHARDIYHTYVTPELDDRRRRQLIREAAFVITVSDYNRTHLAALAYPGDGARVKRLYNGIDLERFRPTGAHYASHHFVAVGRLVEKKGYPDLIEACRLLASHHPRFNLSIVGDGPERERLCAQIDAAGLGRQIRLCGALTQPQVIDLLGSATALVLPCVVCQSGDRDGLPTALLEAMAMGLPTISTEVAGVPEIIDHGHTGFLVPQRQPAALAAAMAELLDHPQRRREMGKAGREKAQRLFNLRQNVSQLVTYFRTASERQTRGNAHANRLYCG